MATIKQTAEQLKRSHFISRRIIHIFPCSRLKVNIKEGSGASKPHSHPERSPHVCRAAPQELQPRCEGASERPKAPSRRQCRRGGRKISGRAESEREGREARKAKVTAAAAAAAAACARAPLGGRRAGRLGGRRGGRQTDLLRKKRARAASIVSSTSKSTFQA